MSSLIQWHEPMRTSNTPVKTLIRTTFPPSLLSHPYPKIIMSSLIQWHEPTRTSNTPVKPLIWTTFPPSLLSHPYPKIIMSSLIQQYEPTRTLNTLVKPLIWTTCPPSPLSCPYPKIIISSFIQQHKPTRTSNTLVKPLIQTTFPPSPLSCPYPKIIGATTLPILLPPMMNQQPQMTSIGTLCRTTCIFISDSPLPQMSSHPNQAQRSGGKFVWRWRIRRPLSAGSIKPPSPTSSWPYSRVGV